MESSMTDPKCPKCGHEMENGFMVDQAHGAIAEARWAEGESTYSFWTGVQVRGRTQYRVRTYRCTNCGFLEAYALDAPTERPPMFGKK
jgi:predicted nucleic-acid-binding Zn-ribbon protein